MVDVLQVADVPSSSRGLDLITSPEGEVVGFAVSEVMQVYTMIDRIVGSHRIFALPTAERFAVAGKIASVPAEHGRIIEKLASTVATSMTEAGALNSLYLIDIAKELIPGFKDAIPSGRLEKAAELSPHSRAQAFVLLGEKPMEWQLVERQGPGTTVVMLPEDPDLFVEAGRAVGDVTKFVGGAALGGVGLVTDTLGVTRNAEDELVAVAEGAVDIVGDGIHSVVTGIDEGIDGTADEIHKKGVIGAVGDGMVDAVDMVTDFASDVVNDIAGGVRGILDFVTGSEETRAPALPSSETHRVAIVVGELFGEERSLGLRLENRVVTRFTKPEAEKLGWKLGDCIIGVGPQPVATQDAMLAAIAVEKEALKSSGAQIRFLVERPGARPAAGINPGDIIRVNGRMARVQVSEPDSLVVQFQDDGSLARVPRTLF